jgi:hypothetical protein
MAAKAMDPALYDANSLAQASLHSLAAPMLRAAATARSLKHPGGAKSGFYGFGLGARFLSVIVRSRLLSSEPERSRLEHTVNGRGNGVNKQP